MENELLQISDTFYDWLPSENKSLNISKTWLAAQTPGEFGNVPQSQWKGLNYTSVSWARRFQGSRVIQVPFNSNCKWVFYNLNQIMSRTKKARVKLFLWKHSQKVAVEWKRKRVKDTFVITKSEVKTEKSKVTSQIVKKLKMTKKVWFSREGVKKRATSF